MPTCAFNLELQDYWIRFGTRKRQFAAFLAHYADILIPSNTRNALPGDVQEENMAKTPGQKQRAMLVEREPWLHVHGLSQEGKDHPEERH
ncbi:MAG: hypothetical protein ACR5LG_08510 [Sodalis sp. (in: enterobacteria)]|uniref:hypothetical protein n=1 Tax=Sodalis sp. (in: enterobacteria) TaxID=1898979 RepID=UPI003F34D341